jgi:flagellar basal-body rod protein FlgC
MVSSVYSALSALSAFQKKMDFTANNVANVNTDGFKKSRVTMQEGDNVGVRATVQQIETPGIIMETIRNDGIEDIESSNVDLAEEITEMIPTKAAYSANTKTIKTQDEMLGALLDLLG